jgi:hypothetical protein
MGWHALEGTQMRRRRPHVGFSCPSGNAEQDTPNPSSEHTQDPRSSSVACCLKPKQVNARRSRGLLMFMHRRRCPITPCMSQKAPHAAVHYTHS